MRAVATSHARRPLGYWRGACAPCEDSGAIAELLQRVREPVVAVGESPLRVGLAASASLDEVGTTPEHGTPCWALSPAIALEQLGDPAFARAHGARFNYVGGAMAGGIASVAMVESMARAGMLAFFGAAGLSLADVEAAIERLGTSLLDLPWGSNLIHSPYEPKLEAAVVDLYLRHGVTRVSASAYMDLTLPLLRYRYAGVARDADGRVHAPNRVVAKVSRTEVARKFLAPPSQRWLRALVESGALTSPQAEMAALLPVATDLTVEADSGGHTDNRPALTLLPVMLALRDTLAAHNANIADIRVGLAGGVGTPHAAAAAFAMGAAYVVTGTINQACVEAGTSPQVRTALAHATEADVTMAPAADMFEMGVELQVLRRGTMFPARARKLWEAYRAHDSIEALPAALRTELERTVFAQSFDAVWAATQAFWQARDPEQVTRAQRDAKHKFALCCRSYLGQSSNWARQGLAGREADYQVWCGPAIGGFNAWTAGTAFADLRARKVVPIALNILHGAAVLSRIAALSQTGLRLDTSAVSLAPQPLDSLQELCL